MVDLFEAQNIFSWSERSGARSAANSILSSRQPLLDHFQTQYDNIQGQKRRVKFTESSSSKRIRPDPTIFQPQSQASPPSLVNDAQAAYENANQLLLSMRVNEPALTTSVVSPNNFLSLAITSPNNEHRGTPFEESEYHEENFTLFNEMGYQDGQFEGIITDDEFLKFCNEMLNLN